MAIDFAGTYEAPISLDEARRIGRRERRPTLWALAGFVVVVPVMLAFAAVSMPFAQDDIHPILRTVVLVLLPLAMLWAVACRVLAKPWGPRHAEYWLKAWMRFRSLGPTLSQAAVAQHVGGLAAVEGIIAAPDFPRAVIEVQTISLKMAGSQALAGSVKRLHALFVGLRFPIQIVVRAWVNDGTVERRWFIAVAAETEAVLRTRVTDVVAALSRAGLGGRALNGDLYDALQACWTTAPANGKLGPKEIERERKHVVVDGEYVRGLLLKKLPKFMDANWLAPVLDGELPVDFSLWLDPIDNSEELQVLADRINEWEASQILCFNSAGYRDPDTEDMIRDAQRTRLYLRRHQLRVFRSTLGFVVRGPDLATTHERERLLVDQLREQVGDDCVVPLDFEHDRAPLLSVPTGFPPIEFPLQMVSTAAAMLYPFSNSSVSMAGGIPCGSSIGSGRTNTLNLFTLANPHMVIPGSSGSGKGYWVKVWLWRLLHATKIGVTIIQSEKDEYTALAKAHGRDAKVVVVRSLDELQHAAYVEHDLSTLLPTGRLPLYDYRLIGTLKHWIAPLVVYDLTKMPYADRGEAIAWLLQRLEHTAAVKHYWQHSLVVVDELGIVLRDKAASLAIETAYRRFRSIPWHEDATKVSRIGVIGMTQLPSDLLSHPHGAVYAKLAASHLYLKQDSSEISTVARALKLTPDEADFLEGADVGDALLVTGRSRVAIHLNATDEEHEFAKT